MFNWTWLEESINKLRDNVVEKLILSTSVLRQIQIIHIVTKPGKPHILHAKELRKRSHLRHFIATSNLHHIQIYSQLLAFIVDVEQKIRTTSTKKKSDRKEAPSTSEHLVLDESCQFTSPPRVYALRRFIANIHHVRIYLFTVMDHP